MDIKRVIIAVALSMLVLVGWNWLFPPATPQKQTQATNGTARSEQLAGAESQASGVSSGPAVKLGQGLEKKDAAKQLAGKDIVIDTPLYIAVINSDGGVMTSFKLKKYKQTIEADSGDVDLIGSQASTALPLRLVLGGEPEWTYAGEDKYTLTRDGQTAALSFTGTLGDVGVKRDILFNADSYVINDTVAIENSTTNRLTGAVGFTLASSPLTEDDDRYNRTRVASLNSAGFDEEADADDLKKDGYKRGDKVMWGGLQSNYFLLALLPDLENLADEAGATFRAKMGDDNVYSMIMDEPLGAIEPNQTKTYSCSYFLGPKEQKLLDQAPNNLGRAVDLGWFDFIAKPLLVALEFINSFVMNYGVAIIILTVIIKLVLWPLSHKSYKSMEQMKKLQPMMAKIREKHKNDRQKMNEEMMSLYKTYKVNPAGGCLPMVLQIPVFIGLYQALLNSIELRHASFITHLPFTDLIWLADLSAKDPYYITPIVMGATMFLQQKMTPSPGDPTQAKIMLFMPIFFTFIFLNFPAGLVIYWLANNVLSIAQQWWMLRKS